MAQSQSIEFFRAAARRWCRIRMNPSAISGSACRPRPAKPAMRRSRSARQVCRETSHDPGSHPQGAAGGAGAERAGQRCEDGRSPVGRCNAFGALLGRKAVSASTLGRATTAARGMRRVGKESEDVTRATDNVNALKTQLADLEAAMQEDVRPSRPTGTWRTSRSIACSSSRNAAGCPCNSSHWSGSLRPERGNESNGSGARPLRRRGRCVARLSNRFTGSTWPSSHAEKGLTASAGNPAHHSFVRSVDQDVPGAALRRGRRGRGVSS